MPSSAAASSDHVPSQLRIYKRAIVDKRQVEAMDKHLQDLYHEQPGAEGKTRHVLKGALVLRFQAEGATSCDWTTKTVGHGLCFYQQL
jgi:hypothetical protein